MSEFFGSIWWLLVSLGVLITFHEFGHFWVARRCGVKVLRFSIGFGQPLWLRRGRDGTEYCVAWIPLGGYVKMLGEEPDSPVPAELKAQALDQASVFRRIAISFAGPAANLILCVLLLWGMFVIGRPDYAPVVGRAQGLAATAGLHAGDTLLAVGSRATPTWKEAEMALISVALDRADVAIRVRQASGTEASRELRASTIPRTSSDIAAIGSIGIQPRHQMVPAIVTRVESGKPAWGVLAEGDRVTAIDGHPVRAYDDIAPLLKQLGERGGEAMVEVQRAGDRLAFPLAPRRLTSPSGQSYWGLGVTMGSNKPPPKDAVLRYGPIDAIPAAFDEATHQAGEFFSMLRRAFTGAVSVRNTVAGPITIARASNAMANEGVATYLWLLALLSLSLGILNLLPIPILDGGHLLYYLIELVKGSPVSERVQAAGNFVGLALIVGLMGLAFYNDIVNNLAR
ncbi:RIP metalloprotease RseP [Lysobacter fragariae]